MTIITENHPKWQFYSHLRKCAEITTSGDGTHFGLNCSHCPTIFTNWRDIEDFISHLQQKHADVLHTEGPQRKSKSQQEQNTKKRKLDVDLDRGAASQKRSLRSRASRSTAADSFENGVFEVANSDFVLKQEVNLESIKAEEEEGVCVVNEQVDDPLEGANSCVAAAGIQHQEVHLESVCVKEEACMEIIPIESDSKKYTDSEDNKLVASKSKEEESLESGHSYTRELEDNISSKTNLEKNKTGNKDGDKDDAINYELDLLTLGNREALSYIIEMHRQNPMLWDRKHAFYPSSRSKKLKVYNEIGKGLDALFKLTMSAKDIREAFMGLEKMYGEYVSFKKGKIKHKQPEASKFWCFHQLEFLAGQEDITANSTVALKSDHQIQLAEIYKQSSLLWDLNCNENHDQKKRLETLHQMLKESNEIMNLNLTLPQLRNGIQKLRSNYRENRRQRLECEKNKANFVPTRPELYEKLRFLEPFIGPFNCDKCSEGYFQGFQYVAYKTHMAAHEGREPYTCNICQKGFKNSLNLEVHVQRHNGDKQYGCSYCDKTFVSAAESKLHEYTHTGKKNYVCHFCGLAFRTASGLRPHIATHDPNGKSFQCPHCPKKFSRKSLREHMNTHQGERSSVCPVCGKGFVQRKTMLQHLQLHDKVKRYQCDICDKRFAQVAGLCTHRRTQHNIVKSN